MTSTYAASLVEDEAAPIHVRVKTVETSLQGAIYLLRQKFCACFVLKSEGRGGEKGGRANFKTKYTEPSTQEIHSTLYNGKDWVWQRSFKHVFIAPKGLQNLVRRDIKPSTI